MEEGQSDISLYGDKVELGWHDQDPGNLYSCPISHWQPGLKMVYAFLLMIAVNTEPSLEPFHKAFRKALDYYAHIME